MIACKVSNNNKQRPRPSRRPLMMAGATQASSSSSNSNKQQANTSGGRTTTINDMINGNESGDNDEENIVIDMCDEDEDDFELDVVDNDNDDDNNQLSSSTAEFLNGGGNKRSNQHHQQEDENHNDANFSAKLKSANYLNHQAGPSSNPIDNFTPGDLVWFDPNQLGYSIPGKVLDVYPDLQLLTVEGYAQPDDIEMGDDLVSYNRQLIAADEELQVYDLSDPFQLSTLKVRYPLTREFGKVDLIQLDELSLESIIWNLKLRYKQDLIYTNCGSKILLSVNPFKQLNSIYDLDQADKYDSFDSNKLRLLSKFELHSPSSNAQATDRQSYTKLLRWLLLNNNNNNNNQDGNNKQTEEEAHIFALANRALMKLLISGQDQCFVLLGESGSGKTEACKLLVQYLASINKSPTNLMTEQILESIQVLESFGNAKTIHNDNSSRFGKMLEIEFSLLNGFIMNAKTIDLNLLDRSRIVCQVDQERNYHVFYELLAGLSSAEKEKYGLQNAEKYFYLNQGNCVELQTKEDGEDFRSLLASMQVLGFNYEEQDTIFRVLASVLHLGNIYFHRKVLAVRSGKLAALDASAAAASGGVEGVDVGSDTEVRWISHLLQIQFDSVMRCLTVRTTETTSSSSVQDKIVTPLNIDQALDTRDAIARTLYNCLFKWLVQRINVMISAGKPATGSETPSSSSSSMEDQTTSRPPYGLCRTSESLCEFQPDRLQSSRDSTLIHQRSSSHRKLRRQQLTAASISILDSFGFENLHENNFEQLCINYSAELLHYHTSRYLLRLEQSEYTKERLKWTPLGFGDANHLHSAMIQQLPATVAPNSTASAGVVNLLSKKPLGILALLDDECNFPKATDQSFVEKCHHNHTLNENYQRARLAPNCNQEFGVRHFRQQTKLVWYQVEGFIEKNRDTLRPDILDLLLNSNMSIVVDMFRKLHKSGPLLDAGGPAQGKTLSRTYDGRYVSMKPRATTVAAKFQDTLQNNKVLDSINPRLTPQTTQTTTTTTTKRTNEHQQLKLRQPGEPWFIVCLKPNRSRTPALFDVAYVQDQVISMNLYEIAQLRQRGYPFKMRFDEFVQEYLCLVPSRYLNSMSVKKGQVKRGIRDVCKSIVEYSSASSSLSRSQQAHKKLEFQCGLTKVFLSERLYLQLEQRRLSIHQEAILLLQRTIRMWMARSRYLQQRDAATVIQAHARGHAARKEFWRQYSLVVYLQRRWRHQMELRHQRRLEEQRQLRRNQQQFQLQELQKKQQVNQFRFRQQSNQQQVNGSAYATGKASGLDIPEDLAQLYRLQREWLPVHDLSHLHEVELKNESNTKHNNQQLVEDCEQEDRFALQEFLFKFYTKDSPQFGYSRLAISRPFDWPNLVKRKKIALKRSKQCEQDLTLRCELISGVKQRFESIRGKACAMYKLVLRYVDSDNSRIEQDSDAISASQKLIKFKLLADYVIYMCIEEPLLRNELYLQLASLSWQNPKQKSSENCWRFMLNCLSCFAPESRLLMQFLLRYTIDNCCYEKYRQSLLDKLADYLSCKEQPQIARRFPPSMLEYRANSRGIKNLALTASTYDQNETKTISACVESQSTSQGFAREALLASYKSDISEQNLFGWTIDVVPSGEQADGSISNRLRGDDKILDHFSEIELQPEFMQLVQAAPRLDEHNYQMPASHSDYETIAPVNHQPASMSSRRRSMDGSRPSSYQNRNQNRVSSDLELESPRSSGLSQTSRLNRRYMMQQQQPDYSHNGEYYDPTHGHYADPTQHQQQAMMLTSKNQFNRRSMSMQELQLASSALNGRYMNNSNHYACSPNLSNESAASMRPQRSQTPTCYTQRMSSSAYGSEPYHQGPGMPNHNPYHRGQQHSSNSLSRDPSRRPRRSASSSNFAAPLPVTGSRKNQLRNGNYRAGSDYASACCSDYERIQDQPFARPLPTPSVSSYGQRPNTRLPSRRPHPSGVSRQQQINRRVAGESHYVASSAMSDTSEAPSLASHVRGVKVPQTNGDLDQYLDDLFNPMLDNEDEGEMSDARSLAPSMRGPNMQKASLLDNLCDPHKLSKIIRGRDEPPVLHQEEETNKRESLSPTFESLLTSLRHGDGGVPRESDDEDQAAGSRLSIGAHQLGEMNLSQLKALNEKLEQEIASSSLQDIPVPPPQPSFAQSSSTTVVQSSPFEDLYDRAKTIRIGKVRWPPHKDEPVAKEKDKDEGEDEDESAATQQVEPAAGASQGSDIQQVQQQQQPVPVQVPMLMGGSVGKLKISSEMKAKLEQLTNTGNDSSPPSNNSNSNNNNKPPTVQQQAVVVAGSGIVSQAKSSLMASSSEQSGQVNRLAMQRKHLLESQLLGSAQSPSLEGGGGSNRDSFGGSKVMAAKQQLAAAAGVALALLDSGSACNSQASSRRQSTALLDLQPKGGRDLHADELGPQSRSAISQRQAFYQSVELDAACDMSTGGAPTRNSQLLFGGAPEVIVEEPAGPNNAGSESHLATIEPIPAPLPTAVSSENLGGLNATHQRGQHQSGGLTRAMQMSSDLNEAGKCSPIGQASERIYGQSIAKTLAQRQQENLKQLPDREESSPRDWIASSPDQQQRAPLQLASQPQTNNKRSAPSQSSNLSSSHNNNNNKRPRSSSYQQQLQKASAKNALTYANVNWQLKLRKEFFLPSESYDNPLILELIFCQLVADVSGGCGTDQSQVRLNNKERAAIRSTLKEDQLDLQAKRSAIKLARSFGLYFTRSYEAQNYALLAEDPFYQRRLFHDDDLWARRRRSRNQPASSSLHSNDGSDNSSSTGDDDDDDDENGLGQSQNQLAGKLLNRLRGANNLGLDWIDLVAVHHSGLRLVVAISNNTNTTSTPTQQQQQQQQQFGYKVLETLKYRDMTDVSLIGERELLVSMRNGRKCWLLSSNQATQLSELLKRFHSDYNSQLQAATTTATTTTNEAKQQQELKKTQDFDEDENEDSLLARDQQQDQSIRNHRDEATGSVTGLSVSSSNKQPATSLTNESTVAAVAKQEADGRYSLLQFALYNFREAIDKYSLESRASKSAATASNSSQQQQQQQRQHQDTGTLRGSLKLIETLRRSRHSDTLTSATSRADSKQPEQQEAHVDWTWKELAQMVKFTTKPLKLSLLKVPSGDLNKRAVECFAAIMQYMGDLSANHPSCKLNEVECVYLILMNCHNYPILRDEIYCQLMKQTTNNRSEQQDSCLRGWRLFSMIGAYFDCSDLLKPYLLKYLETAAYDKRRAYCSIALICLQNLRKTFKFGGRKNVPSIEEIAATSAGRNSKRQIYRLPGGTERVINTKSSTVVDDIIHEICSSMLSVSDQDEMLEFSLYCIADGDLYTMPLNRDEYILDITTELIKNHQQYFLIFCRSIWHFPLRLDSKLYIEVIFNQIAPDYLEGLLLVLPDLNQQQQQQQQLYSRRLSSASSSFTTTTTSTPATLNNRKQQLNNEQTSAASAERPASKYQLRLKAKLVKEIARIAALLHRASGTDYMPHRDEVKYLLPKPIIAAMKHSSQSLRRETTSATAANSHLGTADEDTVDQTAAGAADTVVTTPQKWVELVQENWREMSAFDTLDAKAQFLEIVRHWPLFGSSFFAIKLIQRDLIQPMEFILALNKLGIQMLDLLTHETVHRYPFNEVISTRKVRSEDGALFLDLKCGNLMKRTIIRIQTDQAHEISRLIRQYIDIELIQQKQQQQQQQTSHQQIATTTATPSLAGSESGSTRYHNNHENSTAGADSNSAD